MKESERYKFHDTIRRSTTEWNTLFTISGPYVGRYLVNVQSEHPQQHKLWLVENGFVHNLWTRTNEYLEGLYHQLLLAQSRI